jgi:hypothetical protein
MRQDSILPADVYTEIVANRSSGGAIPVLLLLRRIEMSLRPPEVGWNFGV